jgi:hypothetical protein
MRLRTAIFPVLAVFALSMDAVRTAPAPKSKNPTVKDARHYLQKKYADSEKRLCYKTTEDIVAIDSPILVKYLSRTRFFTTKLQTNYWSYPEVETLVSVSISGDKITCRDCFSPMFTTVSPEFRTQFRNLRANTPEDRKEVGEAIAALFQKITYKGGLQNGDFRERSSHVELFTDKRHWRTIHFDFDEEGRLTSISFENPATKEKD